MNDRAKEKKEKSGEKVREIIEKTSLLKKKEGKESKNYEGIK